VSARRFRSLPTRRLGDGLQVIVAKTMRSRLVGLAFLSELGRSVALELPRCRSVHTFGMRFSIDVVFLDGQGAPIRVVEGVSPRRITVCRSAKALLETEAGEGARFVEALRQGEE